jgi:hypothetical protein
LTLSCLGLPGLAVALTAAPPTNTYAQELLEELRGAHPELLGASISAAAPKAASGGAPAAVIVASTDRTSIGAPADPADLAAAVKGTTSSDSSGAARIEVRLPLRDVSGDTVGALHLSYPRAPGAQIAGLEQSAERIRDHLQRRISHLGNLFDPFPYEPDAPAHIQAQQLVEEFLDEYPQIEILAIHVTPPDSDYNIIAGSNIGRIGKKADNDDMRCVFTGKPNLEINSTGKRFESEMQLHDRSGKVIGALGVVVAYKRGDDKEALHARAERIRAEMERKIPDSPSLFQPATPQDSRRKS